MHRNNLSRARRSDDRTGFMIEPIPASRALSHLALVVRARTRKIVPNGIAVPHYSFQWNKRKAQTFRGNY
jgi:hypothetical protein